jgi:hypothetical protein
MDEVIERPETWAASGASEHPLDPRAPATRLDDAIAHAEVAARWAAAAAAEQFRAIAETLSEARAHPELFLGPPARHRLSARDSAAAADFAERAAVADLALRLRLPESTVRTQGVQADLLRRAVPRVWAAFREGEIGVPQAAATAAVLAELPDEPALHAALDAELIDPAQRLTAARFREKARTVRERLHPRPLAERHDAARGERRVWLENDPDGMCWLTAHLPADVGRRAMTRVDAAASHLAGRDDETRTLAQLRADVLGELLTGDGAMPAPSVGGTAGEGDESTGRTGRTGLSIPRSRVTVAVTVPVLTLLGVSEQPGTLEGYGPIDAGTARELAAHAPSFTRILTHPITGTVLDLDRMRYRPPADLKRWIGLRDQHCTFPGCGRRTADCDLDHVTAWVEHGSTSVENLAHLCRHHHRLKHESAWQVRREPDGRTVWTSPTGALHVDDPPPF